jgi:hypothetical protein
MPKRDKRARSESSSSSSDEEDFHASQKGVYITVQNNYESDSSDSEKEHKRHHKRDNKDKKDKCDKKEKDKDKEDADSDREKRKPRCRSSSSSSSSDDSDEDKSKCSFEEIYRYYKCRLLNDDELMAGGSTAFINTYNNKILNIGRNYSVETENISIVSNIDRSHPGSPYFVRESGVYIIFFAINCDQSSQFCLFVNGVERPLYRGGNNSGAGQLILRSMVALEKNDSVLIRNSISSAAMLTSNVYVGGLQVGNDNTFLILKVAALCPPKSTCEWKEDHHSKKKTYLFSKILYKMLTDKDLMLQGFRTHGSFYNTKSQVVNTEANVLFTKQTQVTNLTWAGADEVKMQEDGVYKVFFQATTNTQAQFAFAVNGVPLDYTIQGSNRGAGQITIRALLELKKDDVLTVKNHTSANGSVVLSEQAGGVQDSMSALLTVFKVAAGRACCPPLIKLNKYHVKCYEQFKSFLLSKKCLQLYGSSAYSSVTNSHHENIPVGDSIEWAHNILYRNVWHIQGYPNFRVEEDGVYDIFGDIITDQPSQLTIFVNGTPDLTTVSGRDSGAGRCLMRQFIELHRGDMITVRNFESYSGEISTAVNAGGELVGQNAQFMFFKLSPLPSCKPEPPVEPSCPPPPPPCPPPKKHHHHRK